jgi:hypothetical protein
MTDTTGTGVRASLGALAITIRATHHLSGDLLAYRIDKSEPGEVEATPGSVTERSLEQVRQFADFT